MQIIIAWCNCFDFDLCDFFLAGLVSDAFHLSFGCGVLTFSLFAMTWANRPPDKAYTYGYMSCSLFGQCGFRECLDYVVMIDFEL